MPLLDARVAVVELTAPAGDQAVPEWLCILPAGVVRSLKGTFLMDETARQEIIRHWQQRGLDVVFDYEHATLNENAAPAPASGWIKELADRGDAGLWGRVEWTSTASQHLAQREYRYHSPVVLVRKSDNRGVYLHSCALTNTPAIDGLQPLVASLRNINFRQFSVREDEGMDWLEYLKSVLQLPADAGWDQVMQTIQNLARQVDEAETVVSENKALLAALDLPETATADQARGKIMSLRNPAGYIPVDEHLRVKAELQALKAEGAQRAATDLVEKALTAGKITPAQKEWATAYALKDPTGFAAFVEIATPVVPVGKELGGPPPRRPDPARFDETQTYINSLLGVTAEDIAKHGGGK